MKSKDIPKVPGLVSDQSRTGGVPWGLSGLRIWHCHCSRAGSVPGLGTSACHRCGKKKKTKKKKKKKKKKKQKKKKKKKNKNKKKTELESRYSDSLWFFSTINIKIPRYGQWQPLLWKKGQRSCVLISGLQFKPREHGLEDWTGALESVCLALATYWLSNWKATYSFCVLVSL